MTLATAPYVVRRVVGVGVVQASRGSFMLHPCARAVLSLPAIKLGEGWRGSRRLRPLTTLITAVAMWPMVVVVVVAALVRSAGAVWGRMSQRRGGLSAGLRARGYHVRYGRAAHSSHHDRV